jgi:oxaloacetate decarboxylase alpha subunit
VAARRSGKGGRAAPKNALKPAPRASDNSAEAGIGGFDVSEIRRLIRLVQRTGIGELELRSGQRAIRVAAFSGTATAMAPVPAGRPPAPETAPPGTAAPPAKPDTTVAITSPMVGTFYRAPAPDADPYVEVGDTVDLGQTVCIIEAMKLMNEIESEVKGRVVKVLVENAQPVEFGQKLFVVEPF